jgi:hypothetical protein
LRQVPMSLKIGQGENAKTTEPATKMPRAVHLYPKDA